MKLEDLRWYTAEVVHPAWFARRSGGSLTNDQIRDLHRGVEELLKEESWLFQDRGLLTMLLEATTDSSPKHAASEAMLSRIHDRLWAEVTTRERAASQADVPVGVASVPSAAGGDGGDATRRVGFWRLYHSLGEGGQGLTFLAERDSPRTTGVVKRISPKALDKDAAKALARFRHEVRVMSEVLHPCVLRMLDADPDGPEPWVVTEHMPAGSLQSILGVTKGDAWRALRLARDVALGLAEAHSKGVVHRDVKPTNILLRDLDHAVVGDFGIAHIDGATELRPRSGIT